MQVADAELWEDLIRVAKDMLHSALKSGKKKEIKYYFLELYYLDFPCSQEIFKKIIFQSLPPFLDIT